jgi:hypothetical protein
MREQSSVRLWAFSAGVLGLVSAWSRLRPEDSAAHVWIELVTQAGGFAAFGALMAKRAPAQVLSTKPRCVALQRSSCFQLGAVGLRHPLY